MREHKAPAAEKNTGTLGQQEALRLAQENLAGEHEPASIVAEFYRETTRTGEEALSRATELGANETLKQEMIEFNAEIAARLDTLTSEFNGKIARIQESQPKEEDIFDFDSNAGFDELESIAAARKESKSDIAAVFGASKETLEPIDIAEAFSAPRKEAAKPAEISMADLMKKGTETARKVNALRRAPRTKADGELLNKFNTRKSSETPIRKEKQSILSKTDVEESEKMLNEAVRPRKRPSIKLSTVERPAPQQPVEIPRSEKPPRIKKPIGFEVEKPEKKQKTARKKRTIGFQLDQNKEAA